MAQPLPQPLPGSYAGQIANAGGVTCGFTCACHGGHVCALPPHDPKSLHAALLPDGTTIEWGPPHDMTLTTQAIQTMATAHIVATTNELLDGLDVKTVIAWLRAGGATL